MATVTYSLETIRSQFQANSWIDGNQLAPDVLGLSNGGYAFAYNNVDINNGYILLDFYNSNGNNFSYSIPYTVDGGDTFSSTDAVGAPSLTQLSNGNVVVVWADANATGPGTRATIFDDAGGVIKSEFAVTPFSTDRVPQVTALDDGGFVVTYQISGGTVLATVFDNAGNITTGEFVVNTTNGVETEPAITGLADGGFVAVWTYDNAGALEVRARIFNADGTPREVNGSTNDFVVGAFGNNSQPSVAALPNGNWAVVYTDSGWADEDVGITLTILDANGGVVNSFAKVNDSTDPENEFDPDITVLDNGFIVVSWTYPFNPGVDDDIYFRIFDQGGAPVAINGYSGVQVLDASFDDDIASAVSTILAGQFVAAWQDSATDGSNGQIMASVQEVVRTTVGDGTGETLNGDSLRDIMNGGGGNDTLNGYGANDTLNGGTGADLMRGWGGDDTYVVDNAGDQVIEKNGAGIDLVKSSVSFSLGGQFAENLTLTGSANINGVGNALANTLTGNAGNNILNGSAGADTMRGWGGEDTYVVDNVGDQVIEENIPGIDEVNSSISFSLGGQFVEYLTLTGSANINATGNALGNRLVGNDGANIIRGGQGVDSLFGKAGNDTFVFMSAAETGVGATRDIIRDFEDFGDNDTIDLSDFAGTLTFSSAPSFSGALNEVIAVQSGSDVLIRINLSGNTAAEAEILLADTVLSQVTAGDFDLV